MKQITAFAGTRIEGAIAEAIQEAQEVNDQVEFEFNGVTVQVAGDSNAELILRDWWRGMLRDSFTVTAYPAAELSAEDLAEDARLTAERDERQRVSREAYEAKAREKTSQLDALLADAPALKLKDAEKWQSYVDANKDSGYGEACVRYAEKWGRLMQKHMEELRVSISPTYKLTAAHAEAFIKTQADALSHTADDEGVTGFMYGAAVAMLSQCWIYGEELRRWHNLKTQLGSEGEKANESGGVLNPAVLTIG